MKEKSPVLSEAAIKAKAAIHDIDQSMHGTRSERVMPIVAVADINKSTEALASTVKDGIALVTEHGHIRRTVDDESDGSKEVYATGPLTVDGNNFLSLVAELPQSDPRVGNVRFKTTTYASQEGATGGGIFTDIHVSGKIAVDGAISLDPQSMTVESTFVGKRDGLAKVFRHEKNVTALVDFAKTAIPPKE